MSRRIEFHASLVATMARLGGSHLTREARERTAAKFSTLMFDAGFTHLAHQVQHGKSILRIHKNLAAVIAALNDVVRHVCQR